MATPRLRKFKNSPSKWEVLIRRVGFETITGYFDTKEEADVFNKDAEDRIANERKALTQPSSALPSTGKFEDEKLLDTISLFKLNGPCIKRHDKLLPTVVRNIGNVTVGELRPSWSTAYFTRMRKQKTRRKTFYSDESIVAHLHMVNVVIKWRAESLNLPPPGFVINTKKLPEGWKNERTRRFDEGEEQTLMDRLSRIDAPTQRHWTLLVQLAIETCARLQELLFAEWREISPGEDFWTIPKMHTKCKKERVMPLTCLAADVIRELKALADPESKRIFHCLGKPNSVSAGFHRWSTTAGLIDFRFHDLRHEGISRFVLTQRNFSVNEIMQMVGHSSPAMLQRYSNLRGNELAEKMTKAAPTPQHRGEPAQPVLHPQQPNTTSWGVNPFSYDFASLRGALPAPAMGIPVFRPVPVSGFNILAAVDPQQRPSEQ